jgi:alpha-N-arabinofuranosidase
MEKKINKFLRLLFVFFFSVAFVPISAQNNKGFSNPILAGFYPDPSICRVDSDYYLVNSTFSYFPGIPIFHSKDLVSWELIGHVLDRMEQLDLSGLGVSEGIFAPAIRYNKGVFYVTCTIVGGGGNFIVTSKTPTAPWSNPVWIPKINGIDPSMFFDEDGKAYILYNSIAPDNKPLYDGHRTIRMYEFDVENLKVIGKEHILINGGTDITKKPIWIEGPHIFKKDGYYYLIAAEGGTGDQHSEVIFRGKQIDGHYISYENNPILTQRHLNPKRNFPITSTGHADFVQTVTGEWWAVFLGCRPYQPFEEGYYNTGRETFLAPVKWIDGWPIINPDKEEVQYFYPYPIKPLKKQNIRLYSSNFKIRDEFSTEILKNNWLFLRTPQDKWYSLIQRKGFLSIQLRPETCSGKMNPSFLGQRQQHSYGSASIALDFSATTENEKAGLLIFQNEKHFYFLCKSLEEKNPVIQLYKSCDKDSSNKQMELITSRKLREDKDQKELYLKIEAKGSEYSFWYALESDTWNLLRENVDAKFLSTKVAGGFVGCIYALYSTSLGKPSKNIVYFDWFEYKGNDEVYSNKK